MIDWLEKKMRTDIRYLLRSGFWTSLHYFLNVSVGLVTTIALANLLDKEILGTYQFILATGGILSVLTLSGIGTALTRAVARGNDGILPYAVLQKLKWNVFIALAGGLVASYYFWQGDTTLGLAFLIIGACAPVIEGFQLYEPYLVGKKAFRELVTIGFWRKPLPLVAILTTLLFTQHIVLLVGAYYIAHALSVLAVYYTVRKKYTAQYKTDTELVPYSRHLSVLKIIGAINAHFDKIVIWHFLGPAAVATFTIAQITVRYTVGLLNNIATVAVPKFAESKLDILQKTLPGKVVRFSVLMSIGLLAYWLAAPFVFQIIFPTYHDSIFISQILALVFVIAPFKLFSHAAAAQKLLRHQYLSSAFVLILTLTTLPLLIWYFGILGAAIAYVLNQFLTVFVWFWLFVRARV